MPYNFVDTFKPYAEARQRGQSRILDLLTQQKNVQTQNDLSNQNFTNHLAQTQAAELTQRETNKQFDMKAERERLAPLQPYFRDLHDKKLTREQADNQIQENYPHLVSDWNNAHKYNDDLAKEKRQSDLRTTLANLVHGNKEKAPLTDFQILQSPNALKIGQSLASGENKEFAEYDENKRSISDLVRDINTGQAELARYRAATAHPVPPEVISDKEREVGVAMNSLSSLQARQQDLEPMLNRLSIAATLRAAKGNQYQMQDDSTGQSSDIMDIYNALLGE